MGCSRPSLCVKEMLLHHWAHLLCGLWFPLLPLFWHFGPNDLTEEKHTAGEILDSKNGPSLAKGELTSEWGEMTSWVYRITAIYTVNDSWRAERTLRCLREIIKRRINWNQSKFLKGTYHCYYRSDQKLKINFFFCSRQQNLYSEMMTKSITFLFYSNPEFGRCIVQ